MTPVNLLRWLISFSMLISIACSDSVKHLSRATVPTQPEYIIKALLTDSPTIKGTNLLSIPSVEMFYSLQNFKPIWTNRVSLNHRGDSLMRILHSVPYYGLLSDDYHIQQIDELIGAMRDSSVDANALSELDILMTDALLGMGYHIRHGRIQKDSLYRFDTLPVVDTMMIGTLSNALQINSIQQGLELQEPGSASYKALKHELKNKIDSLLLTTNSDSVLHILEDQIRQLTITMEQLRWDSEERTGRYILVNIPAFKLGIVEHDSVVFESNIVVGSTATKTPILDGLIKSFVVYPAWNVPKKIAANELLPKIKNDNAYVASNRFRIYDTEGNKIHPDSVKWGSYSSSNFPFLLQQSEGEHNALGIIKFVFDNPYGVYLHDTNAKRFFANDYRALSHGCVRVEKAIEMAKFLLKGNPDCSTDDLDHYLAKGGQRQVCMEAIDLRIRYYTCEARSDGSVSFHPDVYNQNEKLMDAIYCRNN